MNFLLAVLTAVLLWHSVIQIKTSVLAIGNLAKSVVDINPENLKENKYAYLGYKYIRDITADIPDPYMMPITRYYDHTKLAHLYLPKFRNNIDDKLLIGIGLNESDMSQQVIATANLLKSKRGRYFYTFQTIHDFDSLTAIELKFAQENNFKDLEIKAAVYSKYPQNDTKHSWTLQVPSGKSSHVFQLSNPLTNFSFGRGRTDFHIVLSTNQPIQISEVLIHGVKVDLQNYTVINREGSNFLAIKKDFHDTIQSINDHNWLNYLNKIKNVS